MVYLCQTCWELLLLCAKRDYEKHGFFLSLARQWPIIYFFKIISKWAWPKMWYFFYLFVNADFYSQLMMGFLKTKLNFRNHKQSGGVKNWWCNYHMSCTKKKKKNKSISYGVAELHGHDQSLFAQVSFFSVPNAALNIREI